MRRSAALALILSLAVVACSKTSSAGASAGIFGVVQAGPTCPVERVDSPCPPRPWSGTVRATDADGNAFETQTDAEGNYALSVPAGSYTVVAVTDASTLPAGVPSDVVVADDARTRLNLEVDTGIR
jgi:hypothetical protein